MELPFFTTTASSSNSTTTRAEALRWLAIGEKLLAGRDLVGSKSFAARAREFDPTLLYADQIIAVAETLMAGDNRISNLHDWYSVLQLSFQQSLDGELIANQYRKLALLLNPQKNKLPFADQAFTLIVNAWQVLSNPSKKAMYDNQVLPYLGVNPNPVSSGFNPMNAGMNREQFNPQPFEISFQVMPQQQQHASGNSEQVMQQQQPQFGVVREPPPSMMVPQQHLSPEPVHQQPPQQARNKEPLRQPVPQHQQLPQPQPQQMPAWQTPPKQAQAPTQPPWRDSTVGANVTHNFSVIVGDSFRNNNDRNDNAGGATDGNVDNVNGNNVRSDAREEGRRAGEPSGDGVSSFWTSCPYCYYMFEYPTMYENCAFKCQNCKKAFQGVTIPSPPPVVDGQDVNFCCWGMMPLGVSMRILESKKQRGGWTPFSPMFTLPKGMGNHGPPGNWPGFGGWSGNYNAGGSGGGNFDHGNNNTGGAGRGNMDSRKRASGPRVYVDDEDVFLEYSDASEEGDSDWRTETRKKKAQTDKRANGVSAKATGMPNKTPGRRGRKPKVGKENNKEATGGENVQQGGVPSQEGSGVGITAKPAAELNKKGAPTVARRHSTRVAKDFGKLDLNVEFNNEGEEPAPRVIQANGVARGMEDIIEGGGFFEGLDEFLSTLPILNVVGDDKVKAA